MGVGLGGEVGEEGEGAVQRGEGVQPLGGSLWWAGQVGTPVELWWGRKWAGVGVGVGVGVEEVGVGWEAVGQACWGEEGLSWQRHEPRRHCLAWEMQGG